MLKKGSIQHRILKANILNIVFLVLLTGILFNISIGIYMQNQTISQFNEIAAGVQNALRSHPNKFPERFRSTELGNFVFRSLDRVLNNYTSILNAKYILVNSELMSLPAFESTVEEILFNRQIINEIPENLFNDERNLIKIKTSNMDYTGMIIPAFNTENLRLGWVIIYSDTSQVNSLRIVINVILIIILVISMIMTLLYSIYTSKKISKPFTTINAHLNALSERNFHKTIHIEAHDEIVELINNINVLSQKLKKYEEDQSAFLQNISHELRTPLMSIQSYAEGIKYEVVENNEYAADIIIQETKRITDLVEQLTYLSRIDTLKDEYHFESTLLDEILWSCIDCAKGLALKSNKKIIYDTLSDTITINADPEKLSRAIINILSNCIRHAESIVSIQMEAASGQVVITIEDDGEGFMYDEIPHIFTRFYKGKNGHLGIGLAITQEVVNAHYGTISAENSSKGARFIIKFPLQMNSQY